MAMMRMTNGFFCDIHHDEATSSVRDDKPKYDIRVTRTTQEVNRKTGKKEKWSTDMNFISACHADVMTCIIDRAKALGVEITWSPRYKLTRTKDGKFKRQIHYDDMTAEEREEDDVEQAERVPQLVK